MLRMYLWDEVLLEAKEWGQAKQVVSCRMRILLVDDEPLVLRLVEHSLTRDRHWVDAISDAVGALAKLSESSYDLALVDLQLPGVSGDELVQQIHACRPEVPIVLMTGYAVETSIRGTALILPKPFTAQMLRETVARFEPGARRGENLPPARGESPSR